MFTKSPLTTPLPSPSHPLPLHTPLKNLHVDYGITNVMACKKTFFFPRVPTTDMLMICIFMGSTVVHVWLSPSSYRCNWTWNSLSCQHHFWKKTGLYFPYFTEICVKYKWSTFCVVCMICVYFAERAQVVSELVTYTIV